MFIPGSSLFLGRATCSSIASWFMDLLASPVACMTWVKWNDSLHAWGFRNCWVNSIIVLSKKWAHWVSSWLTWLSRLRYLSTPVVSASLHIAYTHVSSTVVASGWLHHGTWLMKVLLPLLPLTSKIYGCSHLWILVCHEMEAPSKVKTGLHSQSCTATSKVTASTMVVRTTLEEFKGCI